MQALLKALWTEESGQDATEYILVVLLVALAATAGMIFLAQNINSAFNASGTALNNNTP